METLLCMIFKIGIFDKSYRPLIVEEIVASPEEAAIILWNKEQSRSFPESSQYDAHLYSVNFDKMTVKEIDIPKVCFETK